MKIKVVFPVVALVAALAASPVALAHGTVNGSNHSDWHMNLPFFHAVAHGDIKEVRAQLAAGADVNAAYENDASYENGSTALMDAAWFGHGEVVKILLAAGADVNAASKYGWTALMSAAARGHGEVVKILLAAGADVNTVDKDGETALMYAVGDGHVEVVKILLAAGADVNAADKRGLTALDFAEDKSIEPIIRNYSPGQYAHFLADIDAYKRELEIDFNINVY